MSENTMTLVQVRDWHLSKAAYYHDEQYTRMEQNHRRMADAIDAHLSRPVSDGAMHLLANPSDELLAEFVAIGLRHADMKNFQLGDLRPAFKKLAAMLKQGQGTVTDRWKLVPVEPSGEMLSAARRIASNRFQIQRAWDAMLAAAPQPRAERV